MRTISPYYPRSWFNDIGRSKILKELLPKLPDVDGKLFITLTTDPKLFESPESAFDHSRDRIRRIMFELRHGVEWNGKVIQIDAPYFVKVEFHANDWAHFHIIFNTRRYLDGGLLNALWDYGRTEVKRIRNKKFHYLLKYVTKGCELPDWVKNKTRIRIIQPSRGFYIIKEKPEDEETSSDSDKEKPAPTIDRLSANINICMK